MTPVKFKGHNAVYGEGQPEYNPLPVKLDAEEGSVTSVWELTDEEIEEITRTRRIKVKQLNFGQNLQPILIETVPEHDLY